MPQANASMFEIESADIEKLGDTDLRELVRRICVAELAKAGLPLAAVTAGGHQDASDGGIDVRVSLKASCTGLDFIPRRETGFQVKKPDLPPAKIVGEMRPDGALRGSISELIACAGAYVIASANASLTDITYRRRVKAMRDAIAEIPNAAALHVDFYDRHRLASWTNEHPGVMLWVRDRVGKSLRGWQPFSNWAHGDIPESEYFCDEKLRLRNCSQKDIEPLSVRTGIDELRERLARPASVVRLVGLSGVGKTRLAQALFDERVGSKPIDSMLVMYTDEGAQPEPSPAEIITNLTANHRRAILIVDNCLPETHRRLTETIRQTKAIISLLTIEYDLSEDEPDATSVFRLEASSDNIIEAILDRHHPQLSQPDRARIAEFSSGNARIALALARNAREGGNFARLTDAELFKRLFEQRNVVGDSLLRAAEICSLVYSFDGETMQGEQAELAILAGFAEMSATELYGHVQELYRRELVQKRSTWRAVLPHAIANRLADVALKRIPFETLIAAFSVQGQERLFKSFSRRLGFLHDSEVARRIATTWLSNPDGLQKVDALNEFGSAVFQNIAPLSPQVALEAIERRLALLGTDKFFAIDVTHRHFVMKTLRALAYDATLFDRATKILAYFYLIESEENTRTGMSTSFTELFHIQLSGTLATPAQRMQMVMQLINAPGIDLQKTGLMALDAMLEAWHFSSHHIGHFGARSRDFGWVPSSSSEVADWYRSVILKVEQLIFVDSKHIEFLKSMLARRLRFLWKDAQINDELDALFYRIASTGHWPEAWLAVRSILAFDQQGMNENEKAQIRNLEIKLRPNDLVSKVNSYVLTSSGSSVDLGEIDSLDSEFNVKEKHISAEIVAERLGRAVALDRIAFNSVRNQLIVAEGVRLWPFGAGLAQGAQDPIEMWADLIGALAGIPTEKQNFIVLRGFIRGLGTHNPASADRLLSEAVSHPLLRDRFPELQCAVELGELATQRLLLSLGHGFADVNQFRYLAYGGISDKIPHDKFAKLVLGVAQKPNGFGAAVEIFCMRLHWFKSADLSVDAVTKSLGRELLKMLDTSGRDHMYFYRLNEVAQKCLDGDEAADTALDVCILLAKALHGYRLAARDCGELIATLCSLQPRTALHVFLGGTRKRKREPIRNKLYGPNKSPINSVPVLVAISWAKANPKIRFPRLAHEIKIATNGTDAGFTWSPLALAILEECPSRQEVLDAFGLHISPNSWSGSLADALSPYVALISQLDSHRDPVVVAWSNKTKARLERRIANERTSDARIDERFE
jgi:hypothetical protein